MKSEDETDYRVIAVGTWLYDGAVPQKIELVRWPSPGTGGHLYHVGYTTGANFTSERNAKEWADRQPWGPVDWEAADYASSAPLIVGDDD